jgi:tRNA pseudouridine13 synthase
LEGTGPDELTGPGYRARFVGRSRRALRPSDLSGNHFIATLRDLSDKESEYVHTRLREIELYGLPNYFDEQRFGSFSLQPDAPDRFIGKTILRRDAEGAVYAYLACVFHGDPPTVRSFKAVAKENWGEWTYLLDQAPRPSNYRSVLTYLKDHPQGYRKALNLIPRRLLSLYLVAYQSYLWNTITGSYLAQSLAADTPVVTILDLPLPAFRVISAEQHTHLSGVSIALPTHRATYADPQLAHAVTRTLDQEGLELNSLKARILQRAYLPKGRRPVLLHPTDITSGQSQEDDRFPGKNKLQVSFTLPPGTYATLVLKQLDPTSLGHARPI